jgi:hypothetical protein
VCFILPNLKAKGRYQESTFVNAVLLCSYIEVEAIHIVALVKSYVPAEGRHAGVQMFVLQFTEFCRTISRANVLQGSAQGERFDLRMRLHIFKSSKGYMQMQTLPSFLDEAFRTSKKACMDTA